MNRKAVLAAAVMVGLMVAGCEEYGETPPELQQAMEISRDIIREAGWKLPNKPKKQIDALCRDTDRTHGELISELVAKYGEQHLQYVRSIREATGLKL